MYKKVHLRLTILCTGITAAIMVIMSFAYLYISENSLYRNQYNSFKNDMNTIATNLEQQSVITMEWLSKMETQSSYTFIVLDNGIPFLYNQLVTFSDPSQIILMEESMEAYQNFYEAQPSENDDYFYHLEFWFNSASVGKDYFCSVINKNPSSSSLMIIVLSSLDSLNKQIWEQRIHFILIDGIAILLLMIFSWIFTGKLLKPVVENQKKQVQFVASASHELRTPLAVILSSAECCKNASEKEKSGFLKNIINEGLRMSSLINDMLILSASDSHQFPIQMAPTELDTLLINSYEAFEPIARQKSISLFLKLPETSIPPCCCDPARISQVISILLHNALSYTKEHGKIHISLRHEKNHFSISVMDNGIGISDEDKNKIFDRFYRAEKSRSTKGHFGLGLSIACEIVTAHHGNISVKDAPEGGSIFTVNLPI